MSNVSECAGIESLILKYFIILIPAVKVNGKADWDAIFRHYLHCIQNQFKIKA